MLLIRLTLDHDAVLFTQDSILNTDLSLLAKDKTFPWRFYII